MADDDRLSAELEAIREHSAATRASAHGYVPRGERLPDGPCGEWLIANLESASDVPRLLAALDAVLKLHARPEKPTRSYELDLRCDAHRHARISHIRAGEVRDCPDCTYREVWYCMHCHHEEWPCPTVQAITGKLAGEAGSGG